MLNEDLFYRLEAKYVHVRITEENVPMDARDDPYTGRLNILRRGEQYHVSCPFCGDDRGRLALSYRWGQRDEKGHQNLWLMNCFNEECHAEHANRVELYELLYRGRPPLPLQRRPIRRTSAPLPITPPGEIMDLRELDENNVAIQYLRARRFKPEYLAERFQVGLVWQCLPDQYMPGFLYNRLYIPVFQDGVLKGWQCRHTANTPPDNVSKYFNAPGMQKSTLLYGHDLAHEAHIKVIVEGVTDVWRYGPGALALFGKSMSTTQAELLKKITRSDDHVVVMLDADAAADVAKVQQRLRDAGIRSKKVNLPGRHDPASFVRKRLHTLVRDAVENDHTRT